MRMDPASTAASPLATLGREVRTALVIALGVAVFFTLAFRTTFWVNFVFSICIGGVIQALVGVGRYGLVALARRWPLPGVQPFGAWPGWRWMGPWIVGSAIAGYAIGGTLAGRLLGIEAPLHWLSHDEWGPVIPITLIVAAGCSWFFYSRARVAVAETKAEAAARAATESRLKLLESQLEPHMLFNTLANLRALIGTDAAAAERMLDHLIAFLRATLAASRSGLHTLADEFARVEDYLALIAVRMGPRLAVRLDLPDELRGLAVPPLVLQPLVENCIRHGLEPKPAGGRIEVRARREGDRLALVVRDTGEGLPAADATLATPAAGSGANAAARGGFGLAQVRERLRTLYGERASLTLAAAPDAEGGTEALVRLPIDNTRS